MSEARDDAWARQEEHVLSNAAQTAIANIEGGKVEGITCRTSICRMEVVVANEEAQSRFGILFSQQMIHSDMMGFHSTPLGRRDDGTEATEGLLFRSGYSMLGVADPE
jgi:hypothetical protein